MSSQTKDNKKLKWLIRLVREKDRCIT